MPKSDGGRFRVGIVALLHESNTFVAAPTTLEHFRQDVLAVGEDVRRRFEGAHHEVGCFFEGLRDAGIEAVPIFAARAYPFGVIEAEAFDALLSSMFAALHAAGPLDGLLAAPHGATVSERFPDADGHWLGLLRSHVGAATPIIGTLDPHANLSPAMTAACDALVAYRTNPHVDQRERGREAAELMARTLRGEVRPTMAAAMPPLAINIEKQNTSEPPCREVMQAADAMLARAGVLSDSVMLGFPYADVEEMGSSAVVVTDNDVRLAQACADELAAEIWQRREAFRGEFVDVATAVERALQSNGPVCLLDMGDNVGGGSPADGTVLAAELQRRGANGAFVCLFDPEAAAAAIGAGVGGRITLCVGGKTDRLHGPPLEGEFTVVSLHDGQFDEPQPRHGGITTFDQGPTAVVRSDAGLTLMLTSRRMVPFSLRQLTSCGVDPAAYHIIVAKGVHAPVAAYRDVCRHFIRVDTPGVTSADMTRLDHRRRRRPMHPFESDAAWPSAGRAGAG